MFAAVFYLKDRQYANLPITYIKYFELEDYDKTAAYKAFWNRKLHLAQDGKRSENVAYLKSLTVPPKKELWKKDEGEKYYPSYIVRLADFEPEDYDKTAVYKAFWNRKLHLAQDGKRSENVAYLKSFKKNRGRRMRRKNITLHT
ncbi:hypothetical protein JTE90_029263 [Oedothorax gibbosus]|uniref:Uncharacterized protein n=1 Tax=Oedothorax gibbosus TaxID=931172 RepID=A0AAV6TWE4_9ARAC|nr:hypothetical protein JTE90_029263 [Oedothorax gibbosus]